MVVENRNLDLLYSPPVNTSSPKASHWVSAAALVALALVACAAGRPVLNPLPADARPIPPAESQSLFPASLEALSFPAKPPSEWSAEQARFARVMRQALEGGVAAAVPELEALGTEAGDPGLRQHAWDALGEILFGQGRWDEFLRHRVRYSAALDDDLPLAEAWRHAPAETLTLQNSADALPLSWSPTGVPVVAVRINGRERRFWLDTGAGRTVLSSTAAAACGVSTLGDATTADTAAASTVPVRAAVLGRLEVGPLALEHHPALVIAQAHLEWRASPTARPVRIDGLLGWSALRRVVLTLDGPGRRLRLQAPGSPPAGDRNLVWLGLPLLRAAIPAGAPLLLHLDSGAGRSSLTERGAVSLGLAGGRARPATLLVAGGPRQVEAREVRHPALWLAGWRLEWPRLRAYSARTHLFYALDGTLGSDVLREAVTTLDATNGRFRFESRSRSKE